MELQGIPLRLELGPRDLASDQVMSVTRVGRSKEAIPLSRLADRVPEILESIQADLLERNRALQREHTRPVDTLAALQEQVEEEGGFLEAPWCGREECETKVKEETKATIRCIPLNAPDEKGTCLVCGRPSPRRVIFARAY